MYGDSETIVRLLCLFDVVKLNSGKKNYVLILIAMKILDFTHQIWIQLIVISQHVRIIKNTLAETFNRSLFSEFDVTYAIHIT